jgi:hypothetical protein
MTAPAGNTDGTEGAPATGDETQLGDAGKAALAAERKARRDAEKAAADALARVKAFEDANKSDLEKLTADRDTHRTRGDKAEAELMRYKAAVEAGLDLKFAARLQGSTLDELVADAKELAGQFTPKPPAPPAGTKPRERTPSGGGDPTSGDPALNGDPLLDALKSKLGITD